MDNRINQIIEELVKIDASFTTHKDQLSKILAVVLETKPEVKIDSSFVKKLKQQIMASNQANENVIEKMIFSRGINIFTLCF